MPLNSCAPAPVAALANPVTNSPRSPRPSPAVSPPNACAGPGSHRSRPLPPFIPLPPRRSPWQFIYSSGGHSPAVS